jgi:hypothetical protein
MKQPVSHLLYALIAISLISGLLAGCARFQNSANTGVTVGSIPTLPAVQPTDIPQVTPSPRPSPTPTATAVPTTAQAVQAAQAYFAALEKGDFESAVNQLSAFSLAVFNMSSGDAVSALQGLKANGGRWSQLEVLDSRDFTPETVLVHVRYQYASLDSKTKEPVTSTRDELWPVRNESGVWRYNWGNLIDFRTLTVNAQTLSGITILPQSLMRYSDRIQLVMLMQNNTSQPFVFGQTNEILAQFHFGDTVVPAQKTQIILQPLRSTPNVAFDLPGLFETYPDSVEIRKWQNLNTPAWFVFNLQG